MSYYRHSLPLRDQPEDVKEKVLWLYSKTFQEQATPCQECKGRCCHRCVLANGYLSPDKFEETKAKYGFDENLGFNSETGCRLALEDRSVVCLAYACGVVPLHVLESKPFTSEQLSMSALIIKLTNAPK